MSYSMTYLDDLQPFATAVEDEFLALQLSLNTIDATELPRGALDTQHFSTNHVVGDWDAWTGTALVTADEALGHIYATWPPVLTEWQTLTTRSITSWNGGLDDHNLMHITVNANLAFVEDVESEPLPLVLIGIAVEQGGVYRMIDRTVRPFSINDRRLSFTAPTTRRSDLDLNTSTMLRGADLPGAGPVTGIAVYFTIAGGPGTTATAVIESFHASYKTLRVGDLSA